MKVAEMSTESSQTHRYEHKSAQSQVVVSLLLQWLGDTYLLSKELGINYIFPQQHWTAAWTLWTWSNERSRALQWSAAASRSDAALPSLFWDARSCRLLWPCSGTHLMSLWAMSAHQAFMWKSTSSQSIICIQPFFQYCFFASLVRQIHSLRCQSHPKGKGRHGVEKGRWDDCACPFGSC